MLERVVVVVILEDVVLVKLVVPVVVVVTKMSCTMASCMLILSLFTNATALLPSGRIVTSPMKLLFYSPVLKEARAYIHPGSGTRDSLPVASTMYVKLSTCCGINALGCVM